MPFLELSGLAAGYGELQILWGADLRLEPGQRPITSWACQWHCS